MSELTLALDDRLDQLIQQIKSEKDNANAILKKLSDIHNSLPSVFEIDPTFRPDFARIGESIKVAIASVSVEISRIVEALSKRLSEPTIKISDEDYADAKMTETTAHLSSVIGQLNKIIEQHNVAVNEFAQRKISASESILNHYLAEDYQYFKELSEVARDWEEKEKLAKEELNRLEQTIIELKSQVRSHGPAASRISKLLSDYLGHNELSIFASDQGYRLLRNGKPVKGQPSEGEKTAIALCYFLTTLESDGRRINDLIIVIDDPVSSLDTKSMNYACSLILRKLEKAGQVFLLTHNHHCMNEIKKAWKRYAYPRSDQSKKTACFLYLEVRTENSNSPRRTKIVEMSKFLREYDSEYHFLFHQILLFQEDNSDHPHNLLLIPNAIRRVLEVFLAFKAPGTASIKDKLEKLLSLHLNIDSVRISALERLVQVESHSDSLDDLITISPMSVEETRQTCVVLLDFMNHIDSQHTEAILKHCQPSRTLEIA